MGGIPPLPVPAPYNPDAGPFYGTTPGALTNNNYLNQQFDNVNQFGAAINSGAYGGGYPGQAFGSNPMYPGSPLDFAQNYLNPNLANITGQINGFLGSLPPGSAGAPGMPGAPMAAPAEEGPSVGGFLKHAAGGAAIGAVVGNFIPIPGVGAGIGAVAGGIIGGISSLF